MLFVFYYFTSVIESQIQSHIDQINGNCDRLDILVNKEPPTRRQSARMKVDQVRYDSQHIQAALRNFHHRRHMRDQQKRERQLLLRTSFKTNDEENTAIEMDADLNHHQSLTNAHRGIDDVLSQGSYILENLKGQRGMLKVSLK
uniref:Golgi SNAP receptor complex member 2 n=1 Tax=Phallusia mammillata TaxID=59560 RepID=A0A6F9DEJ5_9ASCI|nr:Golgi SNAP receptor complex member 2 [Phallusia mammillata]